MAYTANGEKIALATRQVQLQIQNSYNAATASNDYAKAAEEYGRMALEFPYDKYPAEHLNYRITVE